MSSKAPQNEKQKEFFDLLIDNGGNVAQAAEVAGYSKIYAYELANKYRDYILERTSGYLAIQSVRAAHVAVETMSDDGSVPNGKLRLDAAGQVMDRAGLSKKDHMKVEIDMPQGIMILPAKDIK